MPSGLKIYLENSRNPLFSRRKHGSNKEEDLAINHYLSEKSFVLDPYYIAVFSIFRMSIQRPPRTLAYTLRFILYMQTIMGFAS